MKSSVVAVVFFGLVFVWEMPVPFAQTVAPWEDSVLVKNCADGAQLVHLEDDADVRLARHDPMSSVSQILRHAAQVAEACRKVTKSAYATDWYRFSWANDIFRSVTSGIDAQSIWPRAINVLQDLVDHSKYPDVRTAARQSLSLARAAEDQTGIH